MHPNTDSFYRSHPKWLNSEEKKKSKTHLTKFNLQGYPVNKSNFPVYTI